jgi:hypothetical protein
LIAIAAALVTVTVTGPRVSVKWQPAIGEADRFALERRHDLRNGRRGRRAESAGVAVRTRGLVA